MSLSAAEKDRRARYSALFGPAPSEDGRRVPPAPGADGQGGWPEDEGPGGLEGRGWAGGRLDDYEETNDEL